MTEALFTGFVTLLKCFWFSCHDCVLLIFFYFINWFIDLCFDWFFQKAVDSVDSGFSGSDGFSSPCGG